MISLLFLIGLLFLVIGAELLVKGSSKLASAAGISPLVIGLTVVAFGTSAPELTVSVMSGINGQGDIAVGNVVGSNIFNVLFILGLSSLLVPLVVAQQLVRLDVPIMIGASVFILIIGYDGQIGWLDGLALFTGCVVYAVFLIFQSQKETNKNVQQEYAREYRWNKKTLQRIGEHLGFVVIGLILLATGGRMLVHSAVTIARELGISELIIGLTIIAAGTSMPEVATSIIASIRGERDIAVGNVVGSNIFNILGVLGLSGILAPNGIHVSDAAITFDIPIMIAVAIACLPIFFTGNLIARWEGVLFLGYYISYIIYLILAATHHDSLQTFSRTMMWFVIPITAITLLYLFVRAIMERLRAK